MEPPPRSQLAAYVPRLVREHVAASTSTSAAGALPPRLPTRQSFTTAVLWADVSGFTALGERLAAGPGGARGGAAALARHLHSYLSLMGRIVAAHGGDVLKFAGDALLALWPDGDEAGGGGAPMRLDERAVRAGQCALELQSHLHAAALADGVRLSVKVGVSVGEVAVLHLGGGSGNGGEQVEVVAVGEAVQAAFDAEHACAAGGDVMLSREAWEWSAGAFAPAAPPPPPAVAPPPPLAGGGVPIARGGVGVCLRPYRKVSVGALLQGGTSGGGASGDGSLPAEDDSVDCDAAGATATTIADASPAGGDRLERYVCAAARPWLRLPHCYGPDRGEGWAGELRDGATVVFINVGLSATHTQAAAVYDAAVGRMQAASTAVQAAVGAHGGVVNKVRRPVARVTRRPETWWWRPAPT